MFSGPYGRVVMTRPNDLVGQARPNVNVASGTASAFRLDFIDTLQVLRLRETFIVSKDQIYWRNSSFPNLPVISFDPPLPLLPPSSRVGDSLVVASQEQWRDSVGTSFAVRGVITVIGIEEVTVWAGRFEDCLRVRQEVFYEDRSVPHLFTWVELWYAKDVGWVKYHSEAGSGELLSAAIGDTR